MKYLDDKMFKDLSVTAHKWLPITEVGLSEIIGLYSRSGISSTSQQFHLFLRGAQQNNVKRHRIFTVENIPDLQYWQNVRTYYL
jgi:hypothetical protein